MLLPLPSPSQKQRCSLIDQITVLIYSAYSAHNLHFHEGDIMNTNIVTAEKILRRWGITASKVEQLLAKDDQHHRRDS